MAHTPSALDSCSPSGGRRAWSAPPGGVLAGAVLLAAGWFLVVAVGVVEEARSGNAGVWLAVSVLLLVGVAGVLVPGLNRWGAALAAALWAWAVLAALQLPSGSWAQLAAYSFVAGVPALAAALWAWAALALRRTAGRTGSPGSLEEPTTPNT